MHGTAAWLILGAAAIVGSTIGGVAGFGTGVIMIPAIAWSVGVKATVPVLTVCMLVGNSARVWFSRREIEWIYSAFRCRCLYASRSASRARPIGTRSRG